MKKKKKNGLKYESSIKRGVPEKKNGEKLSHHVPDRIGSEQPDPTRDVRRSNTLMRIEALSLYESCGGDTEVSVEIACDGEEKRAT